MPPPTVTDKEFIKLFDKYKSPSVIAKHLKIDVRAVYARRARLERKYAQPIESEHYFNRKIRQDNYRSILPDITGSVIVFSDAHLHPGEYTPAYQALLLLIKKTKNLKAIVCNGDLFDGATISRFGRSGVFDQSFPSAIEELRYCQQIMTEIERTAPKDCNLIFTAGNHDVRFTTRISNNLPEFRELAGFQIQHYFPNWAWCFSCVINPDTQGETWIKHRWHQGAITAAYNNVMKSGGVHFVSSHTHVLEVKPYMNIRGQRFYGVQTGTLSPIGNATQKFSYAEDNPSQSASGFILLTYDSYDQNYRLHPPELIEVLDNGDVFFRGEIILRCKQKNKAKKK